MGITLYNINFAKDGGVRLAEKKINILASIQVVFISLPFVFIIARGVMKLVIWFKKWNETFGDGENSIDLPPLRIDEPGPPYRKLVS